MIPYFTIPIFRLLVAMGIVCGIYFTYRRARQLGIEKSISAAMLWALGVGFPLSHIFDIVAYHSAAFWADPFMIFELRHGWSLSSYGGFFAAVLTIAIWCKYRRYPLLPYLDSLALGIVVGFVFGRLGCFFTHDHIGRHSNYWFAVAFPDGPRHDLGLDEFVLCLALAIFFLFLVRKPRQQGTYLILTCIIYSPARFFLDFLRAEDIPMPDRRYFGLTPAQYCSIATLLIGLWLAWDLWQKVARSRICESSGRAAPTGQTVTPVSLHSLFRAPGIQQ